ncbi:hypothetical protein OG735_02080 [Streptomyces sp. NBC_01210]|uniref:hypothetical protein n=1 Tax=Streptomyces sp. NBC_01210 TaxID=2903774 RepID=UPI002E0FA917|nr:hypothetical protein OG735_02080 [Streptomyces sp. NBC_01210]
MEAQESTDIWFRSHLSLEELAAALDARVHITDVENYWAWVEADLAGIDINISRTHTMAPGKTDTRIFRSGYPSSAFPERTLRHLVAQLQHVGIDPIYLGKWRYLSGNEFDRVVHEEATAQATKLGQ